MIGRSRTQMLMYFSLFTVILHGLALGPWKLCFILWNFTWETQIKWGLVKLCLIQAFQNKNRSRFSVNNWYNIPIYFLHCLALFWNICCKSKLLKIISLLSLSCCIVSCNCATVDPVSSWIECWLKGKNWKDSTNACPRESVTTVSVELINYSQVQSARIILCIFLHIFPYFSLEYSVLLWTRARFSMPIARPKCHDSV